ncbi:arylsulfatase [Blastopirellula marina]|uniref:Arylsulfatase n=1 Tax=Blastopirellula marina TaxID=124 RepID=A0A2S8F9H8_9BACT|nr:arylsulfatase [Blastopirellula marina]PQO28792.1 arylsulfatase [Blastopirellula marina]PTL42065.1 arylsulfatase [Blastopirellula marina]
MQTSIRTFLAVACSLLLSTVALADERPNIVVIMVDDLGFSDLGCFGGEINTPNIDALANGGLRFTSFYNCARCCPTRAALLTGLYPHQVGLMRNGNSLTRNGVTIAEALGAAGYQTAMSGKWHLSRTQALPDHQQQLDWLNHQSQPNRTFSPVESYPINRGFQRHFGPIWGVVDYFDPFSLVEGETPIEDVPDDFYMTDAITQKSVDYIREMSEKDAPFFLYVAHTAPHWPLHAKPEDIAKYEKTYRDGWHKLRDARYERQVKMGLIDPQTFPKPELQGEGDDWEALDEPTREHMSQLMSVHAAMVDCVDQGVGRIVDTLKETGRLDNTLILVLADNGASPERYLNPGFDRPNETREGKPIQYRGLFTPGSETTWGYIGSYWASAGNTPFRYWKAQSFEGGAHTPMIAHWPSGLKTKPGSTTDQSGHVIDILPTCLELAGAQYPQTFEEHQITPVEGLSFSPILQGNQRDGHPALFFEHEGGKAMIADGWKLVQPRQNGQWELYHLAKDRTETNNLAAAEPQRLAEMKRTWQAWFNRVKP